MGSYSTFCYRAKENGGIKSLLSLLSWDLVSVADGMLAPRIMQLSSSNTHQQTGKFLGYINNYLHTLFCQE